LKQTSFIIRYLGGKRAFESFGPDQRLSAHWFAPAK
jgi:hypothetical protein